MISTRSYSLRPLLLSACLTFPMLAVAGGVAEIQTGEASQHVRATLEFDGSSLRVTPAAGSGPEGVDGYLIFRNGQGYSVANANGRLVVMEMGDAIKMLSGIAGQQDAASVGFDNVIAYNGLTALGTRETVAGIEGEVYRVDYQSKGGQPESRDVVLTLDPAVRELTLAALGLGAALAVAVNIPEPQGSQQLQAELRHLNAGVLRFGDDFRVLSLNNQTPAPARFDLPAGALQIPALPSGFSLPGMRGANGANGADGADGADGQNGSSADQILNKAFNSIFGGGN